MRGTAVLTDPYLACDGVGFTAGLAVAILLAAFTVRASKLPGTPVANIALACCALLWNAGGLARVILQTAGETRESRIIMLAAAVQFSGAAAWPVPILHIWRDAATLQWRKKAFRMLESGAWLTAILISLLLWLPAIAKIDLFAFMPVKESTAYNAAVLLGTGAVMLLSAPAPTRGTRLSCYLMVASLLLTVIAIVVFNDPRLSDTVAAVALAVSEQCVLLIVLGAFVLFSRFRFADLFLCHSIRILLAGTCAIVLVLLAEAPLMKSFAGRAAFPRAMDLFVLTICASALLLIFAFADKRIQRSVNKWIFRVPDYRTAIQSLRAKLQGARDEAQITALLEEGLRTTFELDGAHLFPLDRLQDSRWKARISDLDVLELNRSDINCGGFEARGVELMIPVSTGGTVTHVLAISPGLVRAGLVSQEVNHLRVAATQCSQRFDALEREREMAERWSRETLLLQQLTEAELRALRAQINPHFLFNSLNAIANLIATQPARAEDMTLRLAKVFRYVLKHSGQPFASIREEMEFLRAYLDIEEARFGDRLQIEMSVAPEVEGHDIPSLILQPIVENALKHGLGPKPGPGHLWIAICARNGNIAVTIEDDGIGFVRSAHRKNACGILTGRDNFSEGFGLTNIRERLRTIYQDRAMLKHEARESGGSRVMIVFPLDAPVVATKA